MSISYKTIGNNFKWPFIAAKWSEFLHFFRDFKYLYHFESLNAVLYLSVHNWTEFLVDFNMGESLGLGKKSSGPETNTETWSWFLLPIPKPNFGRTLLRGVYDPGLQWKLLQERNPQLEDLINIAMLWQNADTAQQTFSTELSEDVRRSQAEPDLPPLEEDEEGFSDDCDVKRLSDYKKEVKSKWNSQQGNNLQQVRQSPPTQCGGWGSQGERMHPRDQCPARGLTCYLCGKQRFVSSTGNIETLLSHIHSIVCANT